jgi:uncharacterized BrkB/YihY/UPF0761 family membrane protein
MVYSDKIHPFRIGIIIIILNLTLQLLSWLYITYVAHTPNTEQYWTIALCGSFLTMILSCLVYLLSPDINNFWWQAILSFVVVTAVGIITAVYFSGQSMDEAGNYRLIYVVFGFSYILLLAIIRTMKWIMGIAEREDARLRGEE